MRTIKSYSPEVTKMLFDLGNRKLVWVEGPDDEETFREWFSARRGEVEFYSAGGCKSVENKVQEYLGYIRNVYGIVDRDFHSAAKVAIALQDVAAHCFILHRYAIENYLLEPAALREELRVYYGTAHPVPSIAELENTLLALCTQLRTLMAANWVFYEIALASGVGIENFAPAHQLDDRAAIIQQAAKRANCDVTVMEPHIAEKEHLLDFCLRVLSTAHTCINGKHLLHHVYQKYIVAVKTGFDKAHLRRLLARTVKQRALPDDIVTIVEQRILNQS